MNKNILNRIKQINEDAKMESDYATKCLEGSGAYDQYSARIVRILCGHIKELTHYIEEEFDKKALTSR